MITEIYKNGKLHSRKDMNKGWKVYSFRGREVAIRKTNIIDPTYFQYCRYCENKSAYLITELWDVKGNTQKIWSWCGKC